MFSLPSTMANIFNYISGQPCPVYVKYNGGRVTRLIEHDRIKTFLSSLKNAHFVTYNADSVIWHMDNQPGHTGYERQQNNIESWKKSLKITWAKTELCPNSTKNHWNSNKQRLNCVWIIPKIIDTHMNKDWIVSELYQKSLILKWTKTELCLKLWIIPEIIETQMNKNWIVSELYQKSLKLKWTKTELCLNCTKNHWNSVSLI